MFRNRVVIYANGHSAVYTNAEHVVYLDTDSPYIANDLPVGYYAVRDGKLEPMSAYKRLLCGPVSQLPKLTLRNRLRSIWHVVIKYYVKELLK